MAEDFLLKQTGFLQYKCSMGLILILTGSLKGLHFYSKRLSNFDVALKERLWGNLKNANDSRNAFCKEGVVNLIEGLEIILSVQEKHHEKNIPRYAQI